MTLSGKSWVKQFPASRSVDSLDLSFRSKVTEFLNALESAGAQVKINNTLRPRQRAYLMHYSWCIWKRWQGITPAAVPAFLPNVGESPVDIEWLHKTSTGAPDDEASFGAAYNMVVAYGMTRLHTPPAIDSQHSRGKALDMDVAWPHSLTIREKSGDPRTITSSPRNGSNAELIEVGKSYGVIHYFKVLDDIAHWSVDGH
jgi:D-alanyl-D-alanine dipeptidase